MKMKKEHYATLLEAIRKIPMESLLNHWEKLKSDDRVNDIHKRFRWDLYWANDNYKLLSSVNTYLEDTHIDTALRHIVDELGLNFIAVKNQD